MPFFSVITITKNSGHLFQNTYQSLESQTFRDFEWIVVDGSEEQESISIVDSCLPDNALLIRGCDSGIASAFNLGIQHSTGEYILFLNSGDLYSTNFLADCASKCPTNKILCGAPVICSENYEQVRLFNVKIKSLWRGMHIAHNWMCVPRYFYEDLGMIRNIPHAMDYEWCKRVISNYGIQAFQPLNLHKQYGSYLLGGHSHKYYFSGLAATRSINIEYGMNPCIAYSLYYIYSIHYFLTSF